MSRYSILKVSIAGSCVGLRDVQAHVAMKRKRSEGGSAGHSYRMSPMTSLGSGRSGAVHADGFSRLHACEPPRGVPASSEARPVPSRPQRVQRRAHSVCSDSDSPVLDLHEVDDPGARPEEDELHDGVVERVVRAREEVNVPRRKDGEVQRLRPERDAADRARLVDLLDQNEDCECECAHARGRQCPSARAWPPPSVLPQPRAWACWDVQACRARGWSLQRLTGGEVRQVAQQPEEVHGG